MPETVDKEKKGKTRKILEILFPSFFAVEEADVPAVVPLPAPGGDGGLLAWNNQGLDPRFPDPTKTTEDQQPLYRMPVDRVSKYMVYDVMSQDPMISDALSMHIAHALSADSDTNEIVSIESVTGKEDSLIKELNNTFKNEFNRNIRTWAFNAAVNGMSYVRLYGQPRKGVERVLFNFYTHPRFLKTFEQAGQIVGMTHAYQAPELKGRVSLLEPWKFACFRLPKWLVRANVEPERFDNRQFDISDDDYRNHGIVESQNYGASLIEPAYEPWLDLLDAILSLKMSRKNAARIERLLGIEMGRLDPSRAAQYLRVINDQIKRTTQKNANLALKKGFIETVINHLIPVFGASGRGKLSVDRFEGNPNIDGIADVDFHVKRFGSAIGIDPSLLGFGEMMSGGLGDGGFFRLSVLAAIIANMLRRAVSDGLEQIIDVHVALRHNKVFLSGEKPWRLKFHSVSTALEREERENNDARVQFATSVEQIMLSLDPNMQYRDMKSYVNWLMTDLVGAEEEKIKEVFPEKNFAKKANPSGNEGDGPSPNDDRMFESIIQNTMDKIYGGENG